MNQSEMLTALKTDLGITATVYDTRLTQMLQNAQEQMRIEGANLSPSTSFCDANLIVMYAAWLWRRRDTMIAMPRMLRWQLNNRIFSEKVNS